MDKISVIVGTANFGYPDNFWGQSDDNLRQAFSLMKKHGCNTLDTAQAYQGSEIKLGDLEAAAKYGFDLDTKWLAGYDFAEGANTREYMVAKAKKSLEALRVSKVDIFYLHSPIRKAPVEEALAGVNDAYNAGMFRRFGLSNYSPTEVQMVYDICQANNFVLPTVYQGNYSAVARKPEEDLFPVLRKLSISFYAYSPIAGGFLSKTRQQIEAGGTRFSSDQMYGIYHKLYVKDTYLAGLERWETIAHHEGISKTEMAYRWVMYHSNLEPEYGDGIVIGSSCLEQLEQTLIFCNKGALSEKAVGGIQQIWDSVQHEAGVDNYQAVMG